MGFDDRKRPRLTETNPEGQRRRFRFIWPAMTKGKVKVTVSHEINGDEVFSKTLAPKQDEQPPLVANLLDDYNAGKIEQLDRLVRPATEPLSVFQYQ